jgi:WD40 repeat protein
MRKEPDKNSDKKNTEIIEIKSHAQKFLSRSLGSIADLHHISRRSLRVSVPRVVDPDLSWHFICSHSLSSNERILITGGVNHLVNLWDINEGRVIRTFRGHSDCVSPVCMSADERFVVSGSYDNSIRLWDMATGESLLLEGHTNSVFTLALSCDGDILASGGRDKIVRLWDLKRGLKMKTGTLHDDSIFNILFSKRELEIVSAGGDGVIVAWDYKRETYRTIADTEQIVDALAISPSGTYIAAGSREKSLKIYEYASGVLFRELDCFSSEVCVISFSKDGKYIATGAGWPYVIRVYETGSGTPVHAFFGHNDSVNGVSFIDGNTRIISSSVDATIRIWDMASGECVKVFGAGNVRAIRALSMSPDGRYLAAGGGDRKVRLWDLELGKLTATFTGHDSLVRAVVFGNHSGTLLTGSWDGKARIFDTITGECIKQIASHRNRIYDILFIQKENAFLTASIDGTIKKWDAENAKMLAVYESKNNLSIACNGSLIISTNEEKIKVWDKCTGKEFDLSGHVNEVYSVALKKDGSLALSSSKDHTVKLWDLAKRECIHTFTGHSDWVPKVCATSDFSQAFSASYDRTIRQWDLVNRCCVREMRGHESIIIALHIDEANRHLVSGSDDGTVRFWDYTTGESIATVYFYETHILWTLARETDMSHIWFYTESPDCIDIVEQDQDGNVVKTLAREDSGRLVHIACFNRKEMVMSRIYDPPRYRLLMDEYRKTTGKTKAEQFGKINRKLIL